MGSINNMAMAQTGEGAAGGFQLFGETLGSKVGDASEEIGSLGSKEPASNPKPDDPSDSLVDESLLDKPIKAGYCAVFVAACTRIPGWGAAACGVAVAMGCATNWEEVKKRVEKEMEEDKTPPGLRYGP